MTQTHRMLKFLSSGEWKKKGLSEYFISVNYVKFGWAREVINAS